MKIHLMGAPGSGVSTLGKALSEQLSLPFFDTDDFVWFREDALSYKRKRNVQHRISLMQTQIIQAHSAWVLSGSLCGWGNVFVPDFDLVVHVWADAQVRKERISERESLRYGSERIGPDGDLFTVYKKFLAWSEQYDTMPLEQQRGAAAETVWLQHLPCRTLHVDTSHTAIHEACRRILAAIESR